MKLSPDVSAAALTSSVASRSSSACRSLELKRRRMKLTPDEKFSRQLDSAISRPTDHYDTPAFHIIQQIIYSLLRIVLFHCTTAYSPCMATSQETEVEEDHGRPTTLNRIVHDHRYRCKSKVHTRFHINDQYLISTYCNQLLSRHFADSLCIVVIMFNR